MLISVIFIWGQLYTIEYTFSNLGVVIRESGLG